MVVREVYEADPIANRWAEYYLDLKRRLIFRKSIMAALGRIEDSADIIEWAKIIAKQKLSTAAAVGAIRRWRIGREVKPDHIGLYCALENALNKYQDGHPSTTKQFVLDVLRDLAAGIEEDEQDASPGNALATPEGKAR